MKGKILVIDNDVPLTNRLIIKSKYVIAHTPNVKLQKMNDLRDMNFAPAPI